jgi:hypothetical protein
MTLTKCERDVVEEIRRRRIAYYLSEDHLSENDRRWLEDYRDANPLSVMHSQTCARTAVDLMRRRATFSLYEIEP